MPPEHSVQSNMIRRALPHPRKRLGQHFLTDKNIIRKIVDLADIQPHEVVLEIGPGRGSLTRALCQVATRVIAVEVDESLARYLKETYTDHSNLEVHCADALKFPYETLPQETVVVANLPYNISTPLLFRLFETRGRIPRMVLTLQLEVAKRLVAQTGTREYGVLSVLTQYFAHARLAFRIPNSCFHPSPEVMSAVVRLEKRPGDVEQRREEVQFVRTVKAAFSHRRKTLTNAMRDAGLSPPAIQLACTRAGIAGTRRAETLTLEEYRNLARAFE